MTDNNNLTRARGRPRGDLTPARSAVLGELLNAAYAGVESLSLTELASKAGLYDYRTAKRVVRDLHRYGWI